MSALSETRVSAAAEFDPAGLTVDEASAVALELPSFLALVAELAATDAGRARVSSLSPTADAEQLERRRGRYREAEALLAEEALVPPVEASLTELGELLAGSGREIDGPHLLRMAEVLGVTGKARRRVGDAGEQAVELGRLSAGLTDGEPLRRRITKTLDRRGEVRDDATPELARLRRRVRKVRDGLYQDLQQLIARHREHLSEETIPLKEGRLVLLLQAGSRGRAKGLLHGRSGSGQSFYFEPFEVVEANNKLQEALEEEAEERRRVLAELVAEARASVELVAGHLDLLGELDLLQAAGRFASASGARLAAIGDRHDLVLRGARHPLLDPALAPLRQVALGTPGHTAPVVPLDLELSKEARVLVVTGPNAGGKTVVLKTVGLLSLVSQCGLPVPADPGTRLPRLETVTAVVGDEQDLLADRSTFSGRLLRWRDAWRRAGPDALVLLDELGSGTDPEEGAALAVAMLEGLLEKRPMALLTTHLSQLAAAALERSGARCAGMELEPESGRPTFHLRPGTPGGSEALTLAARLGLPRRWLRRAEEILGPEHRDLRRLLAEVETARRDLAAEQDRLVGERRGLERQRQALATETEALAEERRKTSAALRRDLNAFRRKVTERLRAESERLLEEIGRGRRRGLVAAAAERLFEEAPRLEEAESPDTEALPVELRGRVRHRGLGWEGRVEKLRGGKAEVAVSGKRVRCRIDELVGLAEEPPASSARGKVRSVHAGETGAVAAPDVASELNLVGRRVEPALAELDGYLDRALLGPHDAVRVIHGFGTGRLRQAVREHLQEHPAVAGFRPGKASEGGDGATVVTLGLRTGS